MKDRFQKVKNVLWLIKPYLKYGPCLVIIDILYKAVCWPLISYLEVYIPQFTINALIQNKGILYVVTIIISFTGLNFLLKCVEDYVFDRYDAVKNPKVKMQIQKDIFEKTHFMDYKYMDTPEYYDEYSWVLNNYADKSNDARDVINSILRGIIAVVLFSSLIATISPWIVLVVVAYAGIRMIFNIYNNKIEIEKEEGLVPYDRKLDYVHRLNYQKEYGADMRTTNLYSIVSKVYDINAQKKEALLNKLTKKTLTLGVWQSFVFMFSRAVILLGIASAYWDGNLANIGMFTTMWMAADKLDDYLYDIFDITKSIDLLGAYSKRIQEFYALESVIETHSNSIHKPEPNMPFSIEFRNVSFRYREEDAYVLENLNFTIQKGEKVALVGENGVGKSTIVKLILRLYDVSEGAILVNGIDIRDYDIHTLRMRIGVAFQDTNLYAISFRDNIELLHPGDADKFYDILSSLKLDRILAKNKASIDDVITREFSENGIMLSGGEAQKIGLARVMIATNGLILLDEPSSALDPIAEYEMNEVLMEQCASSTTVMIAHRLSSVREMDRILVINKGAILESGTHSELMTLHGKYYEMFTKQASKYTMID